VDRDALSCDRLASTRAQVSAGDRRPSDAPNRDGSWDSAAVMTDKMVAWRLQQPNRGYVAPQRVLQPEHFEFRGGLKGTQDPRHRRTSG